MNIFISINDDKIALAGIIIFTIGFLCLIFGIYRRRINTVNANNGSVAIGGNSSAPINVTYSNQKNESTTPNSIGWDIWNIACGIATLIGLALTIYSLK